MLKLFSELISWFIVFSFEIRFMRGQMSGCRRSHILWHFGQPNLVRIGLTSGRCKLLCCWLTLEVNFELRHPSHWCSKGSFPSGGSWSRSSFWLVTSDDSEDVRCFIEISYKSVFNKMQHRPPCVLIHIAGFTQFGKPRDVYFTAVHHTSKQKAEGFSQANLCEVVMRILVLLQSIGNVPCHCAMPLCHAIARAARRAIATTLRLCHWLGSLCFVFHIRMIEWLVVMDGHSPKNCPYLTILN